VKKLLDPHENRSFTALLRPVPVCNFDALVLYRTDSVNYVAFGLNIIRAENLKQAGSIAAATGILQKRSVV
jgi:hypothetical protein